MQLNKLIIETRVRTAWSAIDLGFTVGRLFWLRGVMLYLLVALPVFLLTRFVTDSNTWFPYLILFWCKPLFERPILFFLSRELFSEPMNFANTLRNVKLWFAPSLIWVLTIRRISFSRGMYAPISLLERPQSNQYRPRADVLGSKYSSEASWLTIILFLVEQSFAIALLLLLYTVFPEHINIALVWLNDLNDNDIYVVLAFFLSMAIIAPFYTAAGFILYISRRVELEGWDIEICFRDWMVDYKADHAKQLAEEGRDAS